MKVYAFMWNDSVYESAAAVQSLHFTYIGAYKAMKSELLKRYEEWRNDSILFGKDRYKFGTFEWWGIKKFDIID